MFKLSQFCYLVALQRKEGLSYPGSVLADASGGSFFPVYFCVSLLCGGLLVDMELVYSYFKDTLDILHEVTVFPYLSMVRYDLEVRVIRDGQIVNS